MNTVRDEYTTIVGVDTHARAHIYALLQAASGLVMDTATIPTSPPGRTPMAIEGTNSYGATLTRAEAKRLTTAIKEFQTLLGQNREQLIEVAHTMAPGLMNLPGLGPVTAAQVLLCYSHHGRVRSEAAFAALAGVSPAPASSGNTVRHRLNRSGGRQLNGALHTIARTRMMFDPQAKDYVVRRTAEGKSLSEIRRCLKLFIARQLFRKLQTLLT